MQKFIVIAVMITLSSATAVHASNGQTEQMRGGPASGGVQAIRQTRLYYESPHRVGARCTIVVDTRLRVRIDPVSSKEV